MQGVPNPIGVLTAALAHVPPLAADIVAVLLGIIFKLIRANGDADAQDEALMTAQEEIKRLLDKRKFGTHP